MRHFGFFFYFSDLGSLPINFYRNFIIITFYKSILVILAEYSGVLNNYNYFLKN